MTQGRVVDLPRGSTPVDFAYRVHTDLGHRCRGAKVDGALVTLNTQLENRAARRDRRRQAGQGRRATGSADARLLVSAHRQRSRQGAPVVFNALARRDAGRRWRHRQPRIAAHGDRRQARRARGQARRLPRATTCSSPSRAPTSSLRAGALQIAVRGAEAVPDDRAINEAPVRKHKASDEAEKGILIVGVDKLLTQLAGCCKPAPPSPIRRSCFTRQGRLDSPRRLP